MPKQLIEEEAKKLLCPLVKETCYTRNCMFFEYIYRGMAQVPADYGEGTKLEEREYFQCTFTSSIV